MDGHLDPIHSPANARVKDWVRLHAGKHRRRDGRYLIDGAYETKEALAAGTRLEEILLSAEAPDDESTQWMRAAAGAGVPLRRVAPAVMAKVSVRRAPDAVIGIGVSRDRSLRLPGAPAGPLLAVGRLEKPGNLGALIRTAYAAEAAGVILCDPAVDFEHPQVIRASRGAVFRLPGWTAAAGEAVEALREAGFALFAADKDARADLWETDWPERAALLLGEEHAGLPPEWEEPGIRRVAIPMRAGIDSLNVSVSGALLLYEIFRRRS